MPRIDASTLNRRLGAGEIVLQSKAQWGRLALYDRVWDGCGCKIDYFS